MARASATLVLYQGLWNSLDTVWWKYCFAFCSHPRWWISKKPPFIFSLFSLPYQYSGIYVERGSPTRSCALHTQNTVGSGQAPALGATGTQRWAGGWTCPLQCCYLVHIRHHTTRIQEQRQVVTTPWDECTTKLIKTHSHSLNFWQSVYSALLQQLGPQRTT